MFDKLKINIIIHAIMASGLQIDVKDLYGFQCMHCNRIVYTPVRRYLGEVGDYYETHAVCPYCNKLNIIRVKTPMATIRGYKHLPG